MIHEAHIPHQAIVNLKINPGAHRKKGGKQYNNETFLTCLKMIHEAHIPLSCMTKAIQIPPKYLPKIDTRNIRLPSKGYLRSLKANIIAKTHLAEQLTKSTNFFLHTDSTSKKFLRFVGFQITDLVSVYIFINFCALLISDIFIYWLSIKTINF